MKIISSTELTTMCKNWTWSISQSKMVPNENNNKKLYKTKMGGVGARMIVQWVVLLPCTQLTQVQSLASYIIPELRQE